MNEKKTMKILRFVCLKATLKHLLAPGQTQNHVWELLFHNACYQAENEGRGGGGESVETAVSVCVCVCVCVSVTDPVWERLNMCVCLTPPHTFISNGELATDQQ